MEEGDTMQYLILMNIALCIVNKSADGKIEKSEVVDCVKGLLKDDVERIVEAIQEALADRKLTVDEVVKVLANIIL